MQENHKSDKCSSEALPNWVGLRCGLALLVLVSAGGASVRSLALEPAAARLGPLYIEPTLLLDLSWVDNLYRNEFDEIESWILRTTPAINAWLQDGTNTYGLLYELEDFRYSGTPSGEDDDFTDHRLRADVHHEFNVRNLLELFAQYHKTHEERGTGLTEGLIYRLTDEPIAYDHQHFGGQYTYGNHLGKGMVELAVEGEEYDYQNFRDLTQYYDYDKEKYRGTFYWNISARTALLFEGSYLETDYERKPADQPSLDAEEIRLLVGATWEANAKTRGSVKVGRFEREFKDQRREAGNGYSWDINLNYRPKTYSIFDLGTRQISRETNGLGNFIDTQEYTFNWLHVFSRGYRSNVNMLLAKDDYEGAEREDVRVAVEWTLDRPFKRWLDLGLGLRYEDRQSDVGQDLNMFEYERSSVFINMKISL